MTKQRLVALLLLAGVVSAVAFDRAHPRVVSSRASISAPSRTLELPPAIETASFVFSTVAVAVSFAPTTPLCGVERSRPIYLNNRSLLL